MEKKTKTLEQVTDEWIKILADKPCFVEDERKRKMDLDYFVNNYFVGSLPMELWNHFDTDGPRTNNNVEGYNKILKDFVGRAHPDIYKSISVFQTQETSAFVMYKHALDGKQAPPRRKLNVGRDNEIKVYKKMLQNTYSYSKIR